MHKCIKQLINKKKKGLADDLSEDLECLCQIMTTCGRRLDHARAKVTLLHTLSLVLHSTDDDHYIIGMIAPPADYWNALGNRWVKAFSAIITSDLKVLQLTGRKRLMIVAYCFH